MPTVARTARPDEPHRARGVAESFGADPARYDRTRPGYPVVLFERVLDGVAGHDALDVGIGTGVSARPLRAAGWRVLGVEPDARMAAFARADGFAVEVARFEEWDPAARAFDLVLAGTAWHWIDPRAGAAKAAAVLRPGGRLACLWNVVQLPGPLASAFADVYARVAPDAPFGRAPGAALVAYEPVLARAEAGIRSAAAFGRPRRWRIDWERRYTTDEWLDQVPTFGGHGMLGPARLGELLAALADAIDEAGGRFTASYAAVAITATRANVGRCP